MSKAINFKPAESIEKPTASSKAIYPLENNGRELSEKELEAEERAEKFSIGRGYKRIQPVSGTLGFLYRNIDNSTVIEHLRNAGKSNNAKFIKNFLIYWDNMDEFSKKRVDIFDILCNKFGIPRKKFWGVVQEGMFEYDEAIAKTSLSGHKNAFVELLKRKMAGEKNAADRRLFAEITNMIDSKPLISIEDKSQHLTVNNNSPIPSFAQSIRRADNVIRQQRELPSAKPRELTEGTMDYIEGEIVQEDERELVSREQTIEEELMLAAKELE